MKREIITSATFSNVHNQNENRLNERRKTDRRAGSSPEEMHRLIHEMAIQKLELEMQNEELLQAREEMKEGLERFTRLYDFAPAGYVTLAYDSTIIEINLTGAKMLGVERSLLAGDRFGRFIAPENLTIFNELLDRVFNLKESGCCEVLLQNENASEQQQGSHLTPNTDKAKQRKIRMEAVVSDDSQECLMIFTVIR